MSGAQMITDDFPVALTTGPSRFTSQGWRPPEGRTRKHVLPGNVGTLKQLLGEAFERPQKDGPALLTGSLHAAAQTRRSKRGIERQSLLLLDIDEGCPPLPDLVERVRATGLWACVYPTFSYTEENPKARVCFVLSEPWDIMAADPDLLVRYLAENGHQDRTELNRFREWEQIAQDRQAGYIAVANAVAELIGVKPDPACKDIARLFYLPTVPTGNPNNAPAPVFLEGAGLHAADPRFAPAMERHRAEDAERQRQRGAAGAGGAGGGTGAGGAVESSVWTEAAGDLLDGYQTAGLKRFAVENNAGFSVTAFMDAFFSHEFRGNGSSFGAMSYRCPNADAHTGGDDNESKGFFCVDPSDSATGGFVMRCMHAHCQVADRLGFLDLAIQRVGDVAGTVRPFDARDLMPFVVDEIADEDKQTGETNMQTNEPAQGAGQSANVVQLRPKDAHAPVPRMITTRQDEPGLDSEGDGSKKSSTRTAGDKLETLFKHSDYNSAMNAFNEKYAVVCMDADIRILDEDVADGERPEIRKLGAWQVLTAGEKAFIKTKDGTQCIKINDHWLSWGGPRRTYKTVTFDPNKPGEWKDKAKRGTWNTWKGYRTLTVNPPPLATWAKLREHVRANICNGDMEHFAWLMTWMAQIIQHPGQKLGSTVVLKGEEGTGKTKLGEWFKTLCGEYGLTIDKRKHLIGEFNSLHFGRTFILCEEAVYAGDKEGASALKHLITGKVMTLEKKGVDAIEAKNFGRIMMTSNEDWVVPASLHSRRFFVLDVVDNGQRNDNEYFEAIDDEMEAGGLDSMHRELKAWKPEEHGLTWNSLRNPPVTLALQRQRDRTMDACEAFVVDAIDNRRLLLADPTAGTPLGEVEALEEARENPVQPDRLRRAYESFLRREDKRGRHSWQRDKDKVLGLLGADPHKKRKATFGKVRLDSYALPSLADIRVHLQATNVGLYDLLLP